MLKLLLLKEHFSAAASLAINSSEIKVPFVILMTHLLHETSNSNTKEREAEIYKYLSIVCYDYDTPYSECKLAMMEVLLQSNYDVEAHQDLALELIGKAPVEYADLLVEYGNPTEAIRVFKRALQYTKEMAGGFASRKSILPDNVPAIYIDPLHGREVEISLILGLFKNFSLEH